ncbi:MULTISPECIES: shikimate kinase [unclassified Thermoactinomyces]|jgi:shikimate kinase|uniref:shikimate kinase n=1 Tax=unclassified Thermoactinomyces TaxID=2634588 RepID=UPI0018DB514F|nr:MULTISPECIES: shikimate kinase [unclassified Thermoactinomyces]MBH8597455.1 shikimate kinase [Thermoactinomyces sp. CICC 10523]MBH8609228.1 shikimate kinase [Thermoactinomyces sp. CICC 10521]
MNQEKSHLILIGMMGTGKTTVGRELSKKLKLEWKDTDQELEARFGCTIAEYFARAGEAAFRQEETRLLKMLLNGSPLLLTTGGGIVLKEENREMMREKGVVVQLFAEPEEIIRRLGRAADERPLLQGELHTKVYTIMKEREGLYDFADLTVDTTGRSVDGVVQEIVSFWEKAFKRRFHRLS